MDAFTFIRVLIVDDEAPARRRLRRLLTAEPGVDIVGECHGGHDALDAIRELAPDLVFLDVQMLDLDGFGVIEALEPERVPAVVFVTAYDEHALRAFEVSALDYLLKPVEDERFRAALARARRHLARSAAAEAGRRLQAALAAALESTAMLDGTSPPALLDPGRTVGSPASTAHPQRLTIKQDGRITFVRTADIDWLEADGNYVRVHVGATTHMVRDTLSSLEAQLDPTAFARIHRATIVNLDRVHELQPWFAGDYLVILKDGKRLKLSRTFRDALRSRSYPAP